MRAPVSARVAILAMSIYSAVLLLLLVPGPAKASSPYRVPSHRQRRSGTAPRGDPPLSRRRRRRVDADDCDGSSGESDGDGGEYDVFFPSLDDSDGSFHSPSSPSHFDPDEAVSSSSDEFLDVEDLGRSNSNGSSSAKKRPRSNRRRKLEKAEQILEALEREQELGSRSLRSIKKPKRKPKSSLRKGSSTRKRRRRKKKTKKRNAKLSNKRSGTGGEVKSDNSLNEKEFSGSTNHIAATSSGESKPMAGAAVSPTMPRASSFASAPKSHPDRTTWEVPSYSHKISTMMKKSHTTSPTKQPQTNKPKPMATTVPKTTSATTGIVQRPVSAPGSPAFVTPRKTTAAPIPAVGSVARTKQGSPATTSGTTSGTTPWVRKFLAGRPKDRLLPLPRDYISDNFNLAQLPPIVERIGYEAMGDNAISVAKALQQHRIAKAAEAESNGTTQSKSASSYVIYRRALHLILKEEGEENDSMVEEDLIIPPYAVQKAAETLYLMLHARFVVSPRGLEAIRHVMAQDNTVFGKCPRSTCRGTGLLPYGYSNDYTSDATIPTVTSAMRKEHDSCCHRYCPSCGEVWISWESKTDGCAWGPSWCHLFLLAFGTQVYARELAEAASRRESLSSYTPPPSVVPSPLSRSFLSRRGSITNDTSDSSVENDPDAVFSSRPTPSVFGFRIHPTTAFGRPLNEPTLRGGSYEYEYNS